MDQRLSEVLAVTCCWLYGLYCRAAFDIGRRLPDSLASTRQFQKVGGTAIQTTLVDGHPEVVRPEQGYGSGSSVQSRGTEVDPPILRNPRIAALRLKHAPVPPVAPAVEPAAMRVQGDSINLDQLTLHSGI